VKLERNVRRKAADSLAYKSTAGQPAGESL
jgi:hypothetical protein